MSTRTYIRQFDRFVAEDMQGRRYGVYVYAEVAETRTFWRTVTEHRDLTHRLADGALLVDLGDGRFVNPGRGVFLSRVAPARQSARPPVPQAAGWTPRTAAHAA